MRRLNKLTEVQHLALQTQLACYETAQELEEKQHWFDNKPTYWKKSLSGRHWARMLFKAHRLIAEIECFAILDSTLSTKRGQSKVLAIKSKKYDA